MQEVDPNAPDSELEGLSETEGGFLADLAGSIPGIDEAVSFAEVMKQVQSMDYDCIVFDTAPTGHTLRLLQFPTTLQKALDKLTGLKGSFGGLISQAMSMFGGGGGGEDDIMGKFEQMKEIVTKVRREVTPQASRRAGRMVCREPPSPRRAASSLVSLHPVAGQPPVPRPCPDDIRLRLHPRVPFPL